MTIKSRTANYLVFGLGVALLAWASTGPLEAVLYHQFFDEGSAVFTLVFALLGFWCVRGAIKNLRSRRQVAPQRSKWLTRLVTIDVLAIACSLVGSYVCLLPSDFQAPTLVTLGRVFLIVLLASLLAAPLLVIIWFVVNRLAKGAA